jgi:Zn finger protein HypA/HybF involved in hydrogenase expression
VQNDLPRCIVCGILSSKFWCKDCACTVALNKEGVCFVCGRGPSEIVDDDAIEVPDTTME